MSAETTNSVNFCTPFSSVSFAAGFFTADSAGAVAAADGMTVRFGDLGRLEGLTGRTVDALGDEVEGKGDEGVGGGGGDGVERSPPGAKGDYEDGDDGENDEACCCGD